MNLSWQKIKKEKKYLPFYVYDYEKISNQILNLKNHLSKNVKIFYSLKANPSFSIVRIMKKFGLGGEIVSPGEFLTAKRAGIKNKDILYGGTFKTYQDLEKVIKKKIGLISLESPEEAKRTNKITKKLKKTQKVILRICSGEEKTHFKKHFSFNYGVPVENLKRVILDFKKFKNLKLLGLHLYEGSRILDFKFLLGKTEKLFLLIKNLEKKFKLNFPVIDIGGGFAPGPFPLKQYGKGLNELIRKFHFEDREIILELGRYLLAESGIFVTRVIEKREMKKKKHLIVGGLMNSLIRPFKRDKEERENFKDYPISVLSRKKTLKTEKVQISGQLSLSVDSFGYEIDLPEAKEGDFILIHNVGAYGLTRSFAFFGSREMAAEFLFINKKLKLIRNKSKLENLLTNQKLISL